MPLKGNTSLTVLEINRKYRIDRVADVIARLIIQRELLSGVLLQLNVNYRPYLAPQLISSTMFEVKN